MKISISRIFLLLAVLAGVLIIALTATIGYREFKTSRYQDLADKQYASEDWRNSMFWYAKVLELKPDHPHAVQRITQISEAVNDPLEIYWWQKWISIDPDSQKAKLGLAKSLIKKGQTEDAKEILDELEPEPEFRGQYHNLYTALMINEGNLDEAEDFARKALLYQEGSVDHKINLLTILLRQGDPRKADEVNKLIADLNSDEENKPRVWRTLLGHAMFMRNTVNTIKLSEQLVKSGNATPAEMIRHVAFLVEIDDGRVKEYLSSIENPSFQVLEKIASYLVRVNLGAMALDWLSQMKDNDLLESLSYQIAYAESLSGVGKWSESLEYLADKNWQAIDYYRDALMARAYRMQGETHESAVAWKDALSGAGEHLQERLRLAMIVSSWQDFETEYIELLRDMVRSGVYVKWAHDRLHDYYYAKADTWQLYRISLDALRSDGQNDEILNNSIMYALLLNRDVEAQLEKAEALHARFEGKLIPTTTLAFAYYKNGQFGKALDLAKGLDRRYLDIAEVAYYAALFAYGYGDETLGAEWFAKSAKATLLPEEKALMEAYR
ncbi:MAG: tetratricopeptide repeat protein [Opitutales bacterium]|nr:tetratricopeptide repeat protein [Opitutales bacterium]